MRTILKKLERQQVLTGEEYQELMEYADELRLHSPESYLVFYDQFANHIYKEYSTYLPRFARGRDDFIDYLLTQPELVRELKHRPLPINIFPVKFHPYLLDTFKDELTSSDFPSLIVLRADNNVINEMPAPRTREVVYKYEDANPYKEQGLKSHFERLGRYSFVSRLQSYRYLTRHKAVQDKIEVIAGDQLGGIFTNKEKSIYYYIFLTEADEMKASHACQVLNLVLYR